MYKGEIDPRTGIERDRTELTPAERRCLDNLIERKREEQRQRLIQIHEQRQREQEAEAATSFGMPQSLPHAFGGAWREFRVLPYFMCSVQNCIVFNISRPSRVQVQISRPPRDQIRILLETCGLVDPSGTLGTPWGGQKRHFEVLQNYDENLFS